MSLKWPIYNLSYLDARLLPLDCSRIIALTRLKRNRERFPSLFDRSNQVQVLLRINRVSNEKLPNSEDRLPCRRVRNPAIESRASDFHYHGKLA